MTPRPGTAKGTVLQFSTMVPPAAHGGAERVVGWLHAALEDDGWRVADAGLGRRGTAAWPAVSAIRNLYWPWDGRVRGRARRLAWHAVDSGVLAARRQVERLVDAVAPDVVVTHNLRGWGYAPWVVAGERGIPLVHVVHDYGLICNASSLWRGGDCTRLHADCRLRRDTVDRRWPGGTVVGVSRAVLDEHDEVGLSFARSASVVHPWTPVPGPVTGRRERGGGVPSTIGYLGRIDEPKGLELLLAAERPRGSRLLVAGDGEHTYVDRLKARSEADVAWLGWVDPEPFLDRIDVLVVPSVWREPFGLVVVEAARAGVPVLVADRPGLVEAARASGARYATFPAGDIAALGAALRRSTGEYRARPSPVAAADLVELIGRAAGRTA